MYRYTWRLSALIISPLNRRDRATANLVLPTAVGPTMQMRGGSWARNVLGISPLAYPVRDGFLEFGRGGLLNDSQELVCLQAGATDQSAVDGVEPQIASNIFRVDAAAIQHWHIVGRRTE